MSSYTCNKVVILGAQHPTGLTTARSLRGCPVEIIGFFYSKDTFCEKSNIWNKIVHLEQTPQIILRMLEEISRDSSSKILLLPSDDESVKIVSDNRSLIPEKYIYLLPDQDEVDLLLDKSKFQKWAEVNGFPVPETHFVEDFQQLGEAVKYLQYPVLLKPLYRNPEWDRHVPNAKVFILENETSLKSLPDNLFEIAPNMLVQQWIPGGDDEIYFCLVYFNCKSELVDYFCGRKLMQWPPLGGSTAVAISDDYEETKDITVSIFKKIKYRGLGSVEYKMNPIDNKMYIIEPTVGRNNFQSYLAVTGNVNLTKMAYYDAIGEMNHIGKKRKALWISEMSMYYSLNYNIARKNNYYLYYMSSIFRKIGFSIYSTTDTKPFISLVKCILFKLFKKFSKKMAC